MNSRLILTVVLSPVALILMGGCGDDAAVGAPELAPATSAPAPVSIQESLESVPASQTDEHSQSALTPSPNGTEWTFDQVQQARAARGGASIGDSCEANVGAEQPSGDEAFSRMRLVGRVDEGG